MHKELYNLTTGRRTFLRTSVALATSAVAPQLFAHQTSNLIERKPAERRLRLVNVHTREKLDVVYWKDGKYDKNHIGQLNYFMRDHHSNEAARMHVTLYDNLHRLYSALDTDARIYVLSGFRTTATNERLRERDSKVAKRSFHIKGRAVDFVIPDVDNHTIQKTARELRLGGVGYYTKAHFVHLDTGYPRHWIMS